MFNRRLLIFFLFLVLLPAIAFADAGTALLWAGMLHLFFGNTLVGIAEGVLLARIFKTSKPRAIWTLILANYFSAWLGGLFLGGAIVTKLAPTLETAWRITWMMVPATWLITLVMELPFIAFALKGQPNLFSKSVKASLIVQTASYVVLFGWYWMASVDTLYTETQIVSGAEMNLPREVTIFYISSEDGDVYRLPLATLAPQKYAELDSASHRDRLYVFDDDPETTGSFDLGVRIETDDWRRPKLIPIKKSFATLAAPDPLQDYSDGNSPVPEASASNHHNHLKLGNAKYSQWQIGTWHWGASGLRGWRDAENEERIHIAFEVPHILNMYVFNATLLPGDHVVFELGEKEICIFDLESRRIALLAKGHGPVAVIE